MKGCHEPEARVSPARLFLCDGLTVGWVFQIQVFCDHAADAIHALPDIGEGSVEWGKAEAQVVGFAKIGQNLHFLNQSAVDAIAFRVT